MKPTPTPTPARVRLIEDNALVLPDQPFPWWTVWTALLVLIAVGLAAWWLLRRRRAALAVGMPPHVAALRALEALRREAAGLTAHAYALQISAVLRRYIEARFGLRAPHLSTEEFLRDAEGSPLLPPAQRPLAAEFLRRCDLVKFALADLPADARSALHEAARRFVQETVPPPVRPNVPAARASKPRPLAAV